MRRLLRLGAVLSSLVVLIAVTSSALFAVPAYAADIAPAGIEHGWNPDLTAPNNDADAIYADDGNDATGWSTGGGAGNWSDDLGTAHSIDSIRVVAIGGLGQTYKLWTSPDFATWTDTGYSYTFATSYTAEAHTFDLSGSPISARYWLWAPTTVGAYSLMTLTLNEYEPPATTTTTTEPATTTTTEPPSTTTTAPCDPDTETCIETVGTISGKSFATFVLLTFLSLGVVSGAVVYRGVR